MHSENLLCNRFSALMDMPLPKLVPYIKVLLYLKLGTYRHLVWWWQKIFLDFWIVSLATPVTHRKPNLDKAFCDFFSLQLCFAVLTGSSWISAAAASWAYVVACAESWSSSSATDSSLSESVPGHVSAWAWGTSHSVTGMISVAHPSLCEGNTEPRGPQEEIKWDCDPHLLQRRKRVLKRASNLAIRRKMEGIQAERRQMIRLVKKNQVTFLKQLKIWVRSRAYEDGNGKVE